MLARKRHQKGLRSPRLIAASGFGALLEGHQISRQLLDVSRTCCQLNRPHVLALYDATPEDRRLMTEFYYDPDHDTNDNEPWSEMDIDDLKASAESGDSLRDAAIFLCRTGTLEEVAKKAAELGLIFRDTKL
jgi:hypothetical protein